MARELRLPELAESVVEGEIVRWLVGEGESVSLDQPVAEVLTDKATVELPSPFAGVLLKHLAAEGDLVQVNAPIALFSDEGAAEPVDSPESAGSLGSAGSPAAAAQPPAAPQPAAGQAPPARTDVPARTEVPARTDVPAQAKAPSLQASEERSIVEPGRATVAEDDGESLSLFKPSGGESAEALPQVRRPGGGAAAPARAPGAAAPSAVPAAGTPAAGTPSASAAPASAQQGAAAAGAPQPARGAFGRVLAVPAARKLARELGVSVDEVVGSGPHGRVRLEDVRNHVASAPAQGAAQQAPARPATSYQTPAGYEHLEERTPLRGLRRVISNQMMASHLGTVRTLHVDEADVSGLVALREKLRPRAAERGVRLSYLPFVMKAVVAALGEYPALNTSLDEAKGEIVSKRYYDLGMAVATSAGLVVPVVKAVDQRSIAELAAEINRLADAAKAGKLAPDDMKGGTFSITNIGSLGGLFSFPIINAPEAAILGVHSIKKRPVVLSDDSIVARHMVYLSLSFDHRLVDGAEAAMFTSRVIDLLEHPEALVLDL